LNAIRTSIHPAAWIPRWTNDDAPIALEHAARLGFDHLVITLRRPEDIDPAFIAKAFDQFGMTPVNAAGQTPDADVSSLDADVRARGLERLRLALRLARDMGSKHVSGVLYSALRKFDHPATHDNLRYAATAIARVGEEARGMGIRIALEIVNRYESHLLNTVSQALDFLALADCDNVLLHLDTFHMNVEEADMAAAIRDALPRLAYFELDQNHRGPMSPGLIDMASLLAQLRRAGFSGIVGVEAFTRHHLADDHANALAIWRNTFEDGDALARQSLNLIRDAFGHP
jgi:D-psicose/D-tagatose/L-ribulose 3-epimerase